MKTWNLSAKTSDWEILGETSRTQAALMSVPTSQSEGGPDNRHSQTDQWLYVLEGIGEAVVEGQSIPLTPGTLLLIEADEAHEIRGSSEGRLKTLNFYGPPTEL